MLIKDLTPYMLDTDRIVIYRQLDASNFEDLYKGLIKDMPKEVLERKVGKIWARRKDVLEIRAEQVYLSICLDRYTPIGVR